MTRIIRPEPTNLKGETILDARISPSQGKELAEEIVHSIEWSQKFIQMTLPDRLVVTQKQFMSLNPYTQAFPGDDSLQTTGRLYVTPLNAMEMVIDRDIDIVQEVEDTMAMTEELKKEIQDHESDAEK